MLIFSRQEDLQHSLMPVEKILRDLIMLGFSVFDFSDSRFSKLVDFRVRVSEENWGMSGDDQLRLMANQAMHQRQHTQLPLRRKRGLRLIEQIDPATLKPLLQYREERLSVRLLVK